MNSRIYSGTVMHARHHPTRHRFEYPILFYAIDLDELPEITQTVKGFSTGPGTPVSLRSTDYLNGTSSFREQLTAHLPDPQPHRIVLITVARFLTPVFNPVSFYYALDKNGETQNILVEVNNTFNQRHLYLAPGAPTYPIQGRIQKQFHVSPFNDMTGDYLGTFSEPTDQLHIRIQLMHDQRCTLDTILQGSGEPLSTASLWRHLSRHPFNAAATLPRIYWQAAQLHWKRKLPIHKTPPPSHPHTTWRKK